MSEDDVALVERLTAELLRQHPPSETPMAEFLGAQFDAGLAWVHFEPGYGGRALDAQLHLLVNDRLSAAGAPSPFENFVGVHQAAAVVHAYGSPAQKARLLRPSFTNEEFWCQLFSEPGAGSDLAGLATSAIRDGEQWIVSGQKVWTSYANTARWAILLARTDPHVPKHRGLTLFLCDMQTPGIEVRPLRQADGGAHFNEVFLTDVPIPDAFRMGEVGQGWGISINLLGTERAGVGLNPGGVDRLLERWRQRRAMNEAEEKVCRDGVARVITENEVFRLLQLRVSMAKDGSVSRLGPAVKLSKNLIDQRTANALMDLLGAEGTLGGDYTWFERNDSPSDQLWYMRSRANTIGGGTAEIMRNLIGERFLDLPGEARTDKDLPWNEVPR